MIYSDVAVRYSQIVIVYQTIMNVYPYEDKETCIQLNLGGI
jgi:hypothetical protein